MASIRLVWASRVELLQALVLQEQELVVVFGLLDA
jgi:hypothetical protein